MVEKSSFLKATVFRRRVNQCQKAELKTVPFMCDWVKTAFVLVALGSRLWFGHFERAKETVEGPIEESAKSG
jgi:hypothetical protein